VRETSFFDSGQLLISMMPEWLFYLENPPKAELAELTSPPATLALREAGSALFASDAVLLSI